MSTFLYHAPSDPTSLPHSRTGLHGRSPSLLPLDALVFDFSLVTTRVAFLPLSAQNYTTYLTTNNLAYCPNPNLAMLLREINILQAEIKPAAPTLQIKGTL